MKTGMFFILLVIAAAMVFCAACTGTDSGQPQDTASATTQVTQTASSTPESSSDMVPGPTSQPADKYKIDVQVNKDEIYGTITAIFRGGLGQNFIYSLVVDVYYPDGSHQSKDLGTAVGDEVQFEGSQKLQERVKVTATYMGNIGTYVIYDSLVPPKLAIPNP